MDKPGTSDCTSCKVLDGYIETSLTSYFVLNKTIYKQGWKQTSQRGRFADLKNHQNVMSISLASYYAFTPARITKIT